MIEERKEKKKEKKRIRGIFNGHTVA